MAWFYSQKKYRIQDQVTTKNEETFTLQNPLTQKTANSSAKSNRAYILDTDSADSQR